MNENLNLVELLKDCPKGTKLYSPALGECALEGVNDNNDYSIKVTYKIINNDTRVDYFTKYGYLLTNKPDAECMLFPSKDQRDWSKWQRPFKEEDIVISDKGDIHLLRTSDSSYCAYRERWYSLPKFDSTITTSVKVDRFATEEEKQKLFDAIKANGYKWNPETKTLEKLIVPKFKVGTKIIHKSTGLQCTLGEYAEGISAYRTNIGLSITHKDLEQWKLASNKFDPKTLQPFDKVLASYNDEWFCDFFSHYDATVVKFNCICTGGGPYDYCVPYNDDTKHLIGKSIEEAPEFYRYWED